MLRFQTSRFQASHSPQRFRKSSRRKRFKQFKFGRKKKQSRKKSSNYFLCEKSGHYAKQCPKSNKKSVRMMQHIACALGFNDNDDLESVFSLDDEQGPQTLFMVSTFDSSSDFENTSSSDDE